MALPAPIIAVLAAFEPLFTQPTWQRILVLVLGTLLGHGRRTVTAALRTMGYAADPHFSSFHQVLNRAHWSPLAVSRTLLRCCAATFLPADAPLLIVVDETLERRWGRHIRKRGHYRDPLLSGKGLAVSNSGIRWVVFALVVPVPWTRRRWALPFLSIAATPPEVSAAAGHRHRTVGDIAQLGCRLLHHWLPDRAWTLVGDGGYSIIDLGRAAQDQHGALLAPLRFDANLFEPAPPRRAKQNGRPRCKGAAVPKLETVLAAPTTTWTATCVTWYSGPARVVEWCSGTAVWYHGGKRPLSIRWVLTRDPTGSRALRAYFCTTPTADPVEMIRAYMQRWPLEVTLEESRAHLGIETHRQWSDRAVERSTPALLGLYSLITLCGQALYPQGDVPIARSTWYPKRTATFSDVLASVRQALWQAEGFCISAETPDIRILRATTLDRLLYAVCY